MDESTTIWNREVSKRDDSNFQRKNEPKENTIDEFKISDEVVDLIDKALPEQKSRSLSAQDEITTTLYELLDTAPHGRKVRNDLFASSTGNASIFQHYRKSSIHRNLVKTIDKWIVEREESAADISGSRGGSRGDHSSAIFTWSSANRESNKSASSHVKEISSNASNIGNSSGPKQSLNRKLQKQAQVASSDFLAQRRELERKREIENLASTRSAPVTPGTFKVDPLLVLNPQALPRPSKKKSDTEKPRRKTTKQKNRLSNLFFWKPSSTKDQPRHEKAAKTQNETKSTFIAEPSDLTGSTQSASDIDQPTSELSAADSVDDRDSAFGEFESASASETVNDSANFEPSQEAGPRVPDSLAMESFAPLQPKRRA
ncbi:LAFA_0E13916g1_1 [Lachancea sp. 'fantastica']|nr:LAFA_0E13916g1_1 [Lachancea sp. 'fantastica']